MGRCRFRDPTGAHVRIADGLDLLQTEGIRELIEEPEVVVQFAHQRVTVHGATEIGEILEIAEQDGACIVTSRFGRTVLFQFLGGGCGQDVAQQCIAAFLLGGQFARAHLYHAFQPFAILTQVACSQPYEAEEAQ